MTIISEPRTRPHRASLVRQNVQLRRAVTQLTRELAEARTQATHDALTGLLNRPGLAGVWPTMQPTTVMLIDLDGFKPINDQYGHIAGDAVLRAIGNRLATAATVAARLGGDEFVILTTTKVDSIGYADRIAALIAEPIELPDGRPVSVTASIGVYPIAGPVELYQAIEYADRAMYAAKATSGVVVFTPTLPTAADGARRRDARAERRPVPQHG
jgi:diguanylate cyclase (GGDEF)-like protein